MGSAATATASTTSAHVDEAKESAAENSLVTYGSDAEESGGEAEAGWDPYAAYDPEAEVKVEKRGVEANGEDPEAKRKKECTDGSDVPVHKPTNATRIAFSQADLLGCTRDAPVHR